MNEAIKNKIQWIWKIEIFTIPYCILFMYSNKMFIYSNKHKKCK